MKIITDPTNNLARGFSDAGITISLNVEARLTGESDFTLGKAGAKVKPKS